MNTETLAPASNFEARKLDGVKIAVKGGYIKYTARDWGIWCKASQGWLAFPNKKHGVLLPHTTIAKKYAVKTYSGGIYEGYDTVNSIA